MNMGLTQTPFMHLGSIGSLTDLKELRMVLKGLKVEPIFFFLRILAILLVIPWIKGSCTLEFALTSFLELGPRLAFKKALKPCNLL